MLSLYLSQKSWLHQIPAGIKLAGLLAASVALLPVQQLMILSLAVSAAIVSYLSLGRAGRVRLGWLGTTLGPMLAVLAVVQAGAMFLSHDEADNAARATLAASAAAVTLFRLMALILLADLVTLSTPTQDILRALQPVLAPLRVIGLSPQRLSLVIALMLRWVTLLQSRWSETRAAFAARGCSRPRLRITGPVLQRAGQTAQSLAEALSARQRSTTRQCHGRGLRETAPAMRQIAPRESPPASGT